MSRLRHAALPAAALGALLAATACDREEPPQIEPRQISESPFQYPEELWDAGVEGQTTLGIYVNEQGRVDSARIETASGYPAFDSAALAGSRELLFEPARRGDRPVGAWFLLPVQFELGTDSVRAGATPTDTAP